MARGYPAYSPALREYNWFWQFPEESVGAQLFHAVGEPNRALYEPSSITVPRNLNGGDYPLYHWFRQGEGGGSVAAVEGVPTHVLTLSTYDKVDGPKTTLKFTSRFYNTTGEAKGRSTACAIQPVPRRRPPRDARPRLRIRQRLPAPRRSPHLRRLGRTQSRRGAGQLPDQQRDVRSLGEDSLGDGAV